ncbi:MAG: bifunctional DNA-binding transcriptional regulator/O6-methylguanine-DNA methyltransferase Ada [Anaerolineae bacterium]|nr:bifunctional DNA-binding transcriptional regulator/O6-methylguanine-DNA methyltransferase Ada [Anaerolineae bacterium]
MNEQAYWEAVQNRDSAYDNVFVYAVKTTGIFCRPTCPSRRPFRENVAFFDTPDDAQNAGYRPCERCHPTQDAIPDPHLPLITEICRYLETEHERIPTLDELGEKFNMSPYHLQRVFKRLVGISPRQYADSYRQGRLKSALKNGATATDAVYDAGYNTSSQVYEQTHQLLGMTPIHYRNGADNMTITYAIVPCSLGYILVAMTAGGVCKIALGDSEGELGADLHMEFPRATMTRDDEKLTSAVHQLLAYLDGEQASLALPLDIIATSFQRRVWEILRQIPYGETRSYDEVAVMLGQPTASRAVARACATNPVALAIPCHRVVRKNGDLAGYRWGINRKRIILQTEHDYIATGGE